MRGSHYLHSQTFLPYLNEAEKTKRESLACVKIMNLIATFVNTAYDLITQCETTHECITDCIIQYLINLSAGTAWGKIGSDHKPYGVQRVSLKTG